MNILVGEHKASPALRDSHAIALSLLSACVAEFIFKGFLQQISPLQASARVAIVFLSLYTIHRFAWTSLRQYHPNLKDLFCLHLVLIGSIVAVGLGRFLAVALAAYANGSGVLSAPIAQESLHFLIPFAAGGLIVQSVLGLHSGLIFALNLSLMVGVYTPSQSTSIFVPYIFVTVLVACLSLSRFRSRSAYIKAGINIAIISLPFALAAFLTNPNMQTVDVVVQIAGAFFGGLLCAVVAGSITPVIEYLGGYVTDMRLIEMATLDHPLLKDLSLQSPGTWNHSMVIGMMVEAAADAIGANPVLARVGAYFHDIGKMKKPAYFVENQGGGENRHSKLSTSMSALIIRSHVKDGIELARKHKLPQAIIDMIPQHHGTSLIEYFYNKACQEAAESDEDIEVDRNLYTYPGPKPQTREAGLLMLADKIESAARTVAEPTVDRIQGLVQKMINKVFSSGELNECDLTLKDLHVVAACFTRVLNSIYHQRVAYAEPAEKVSDRSSDKSNPAKTSNGLEDNDKLVNGQGTENGGKTNGKRLSPAEDSKAPTGPQEDLKRLGMLPPSELGE